jgi:hypothetical protein
MNRDELEASIAARNPEAWRPSQISSKVSQEMDELIRCRAIQGMDELMYCRAILDHAGDFSTSIHGGIEALVAERNALRAKVQSQRDRINDLESWRPTPHPAGTPLKPMPDPKRSEWQADPLKWMFAMSEWGESASARIADLEAILATSVMCPKCAEVILPHQHIR